MPAPRPSYPSTARRIGKARRMSTTRWTEADKRRLRSTTAWRALPRHGETRRIVNYAISRYDHGEGIAANPKTIARDMKLGNEKAAQTVERALKRAAERELLVSRRRVHQRGGKIVLWNPETETRPEGRDMSNVYVVNPEFGLGPSLRYLTSLRPLTFPGSGGPQVRDSGEAPRSTANAVRVEATPNGVAVEAANAAVEKPSSERSSRPVAVGGSDGYTEPTTAQRFGASEAQLDEWAVGSRKATTSRSPESSTFAAPKIVSAAEFAARTTTTPLADRLTPDGKPTAAERAAYAEEVYSLIQLPRARQNIVGTPLGKAVEIIGAWRSCP